MAFNLAQIMYEDTEEPVVETTAATAASTETQASAPGYTYFADGAVRQAQGSGAFELMTSDGWKTIGTPQHGESLYYVTTALSSPVMAEFLKFAAENPDQLNREQELFMQNPLVSLDSYGQGYRWGENNLYDNVLTPQFAGTVLQTEAGSYGYDAGKLTETEGEQGAAFNYEQSAEQQAERAGDDDDFLGIALTIAAIVVAPYVIPEIAATFGISNTAAAAIYGGAKSVVTGGDVGDVITGAVTSGLGAEFLGGATPGSEGDWYAGMTGAEAGGLDPSLTTFASAGTPDVQPGEIGYIEPGGAMDMTGSRAVPSSIYDNQTVFGTNAETGAVLAGAGAPGAPSVAPGGAMDMTGSYSSPANPANTDTVFGTNAATGAVLSSSAGKGIIGDAMDWAKENPQLAKAALGVVGTTVAGVGTAMLNKGAAEDRIQAEKDLLSQKFMQETEGKRQFVQGNPSVFNWRRRFAPTGQPLKRLSTGQPVYQGGLLASRMRG